MGEEKGLEDPVAPGAPADRASFAERGFQRFDGLLPADFVSDLNGALERVLRGGYDQGSKPDKAPAKILAGDSLGPLGFTGTSENAQVVHLINIWHADSVFSKLVLSRNLGALVAELAGWKSGARVAQDQVWAKPPGAPPLVFHRDSPYLFFENEEETPDAPDVMTAWVALDDMDQELGPLEYVVGSHLWEDGRAGSASFFFQQQTRELLLASAARMGLAESDLELASMAGLRAGGVAIHHGKCWHGSGPNQSRQRPRRGIGIHYIPGSSLFAPGAERSKLWGPYVAADGPQPCPLLFPLVSATGPLPADLPLLAAERAAAMRRRPPPEADDGDKEVLSAAERRRLGRCINARRGEWLAFLRELGEKPSLCLKSCSRQRLLAFHAEEWREGYVQE